ncbi:MAG: transposase, partial [Planctomycetes bacterium]|nr:transposase [Planctomycetota bacterium]
MGGAEVQTDKILVAAWLERVDHKRLQALLKPVKKLGLPILATISDKEPALKKALEFMWPDMPHQWCQFHYVGNLTKPVYERDSALKTAMRKTIRQETRESVTEALTEDEIDASVHFVAGIALTVTPEKESARNKRQQVVQELALDLREALQRKGYAPLIMSGLPMFDDLRALQQTLADCLAIDDDPHLQQWHDVLAATLPKYQEEFAEVAQALEW